MSLVKNKDKRTGITYVYESESYWDKEKQQPRSRRHLIGRLDETTGEIVPTDGRGRRRKKKNDVVTGDTTLSKEKELLEELNAKELRILELKEENAVLRKKYEKLLGSLERILEAGRDRTE